MNRVQVGTVVLQMAARIPVTLKMPKVEISVARQHDKKFAVVALFTTSRRNNKKVEEYWHRDHQTPQDALDFAVNLKYFFDFGADEAQPKAYPKYKGFSDPRIVFTNSKYGWTKLK